MSDLFGHFNYAVIIVLMMLGLYVVFAARNLIKKLVGLSVFQTSVFLFYISIGKVSGGQPPILVDDHGGGHGDSHVGDAVGHAAADIGQSPILVSPSSGNYRGGDGGGHGGDAAVDIVQVAAAGKDAAAHAVHHGPEVLYSNPLPHVLILTAIVVGVATLAIGLALTVRIREVYGTIEEDKIARIDYRYNLELARK